MCCTLPRKRRKASAHAQLIRTKIGGELMTDPGKLSFYKPASPLERGSLLQGKLQVSSPLDYSETTPTATTEVWSSELPAVQVVRHTSPRELPLSTSGRFSSNFVEFHSPTPDVVREEKPPTPPVDSHDTGRGGGVEDGRLGMERSGQQGVANDDSRHHTPQETDSPAYSKSVNLSSISKTSSSRGQKRKPKGRVVPSRYMLSSSKVSTPPNPAGHKTLSGKPSTTSSLTKTHISKKSVKCAQKPSVKDDSFKMPSLPAKSRLHPPPPSLSSSFPQHPFTPSALTSSTPKVSGSGPQTATHHQSSFMDVSHNPTTKNTTAAKTRTKATTGQSQSQDLELELLNSRLLQATYLDVKSAKSLREQEEAAKAQLHVLWEEVESRRRECETLRQELETARRTTALSSILDVQVKELSPVVNTLPQLQQHHTALAHALDGTRHELATSGVLPTTEQQLEAELLRSEQLLNEIVSLTHHRVPTVTSLADSTEAAVNTLDKEFQEIQKCWSELTKAVKLQVHETSLVFENRQRQRSLSSLPSQNFLTTKHTE